MTADIQRALDIAREMAEFGIPIFTARPDTRGLTEVGRQTGFMLPKGWEMTQPNPAAVDRWEPGMALCALGGVAADFIDIDPRNGGDLAAKQLEADGLYPHSYGQQRTPSGGFHHLISPLGIRKAKRDGIDYQGGDLEGNGRGFVFIAPTVRPSKETGEMVAYRWAWAPDLEALRAAKGVDKSGVYFTEWVTTKPSSNGQHSGNGTRTRESDHAGRIPPGQGHDTMVSYCGVLLQKYPDIELTEYVERCRARWEEFDQSKFRWTWQECLKNPVMDCWHRFGRGEPYVPPEPRDFTFTASEDTNDLLLPAEWYAERPVLKEIRTYAHDHCAGADAVLYATLARLSAMISPRVRIDTGILSPASCNLFVAAMGPAGGGKSSSAALAKQLYAPNSGNLLDGVPVGSGEGLVETYFGTTWEDDEERGLNSKSEPYKKKVHKQVREAAFFVTDEGQGLLKLMSKPGSILAETIRAMWFANTAGQGNANAETRRILDPHTYSAGLLVGFQPSTVQPLLDDWAGGTPQRFVYCWVSDPNIPDEPAPPDPDEPFASVHAAKMLRVAAGNITVCKTVRDEIRRTHMVRSRGAETVDPMDAHDYLTRAKLAALLALIEGRHEVEWDDWRMAGVMYQVSSNVRAAMVKYGKTQNRDQAKERNQAYAEREGMAESARQQAREVHSAPWRVAKNIAKKVHDKELRTVGAVNRTLKREDQKNHDLVEQAWEIAVDEGWVVRNGNDVEPGEQRPS